jgi:hypothetical protein
MSNDLIFSLNATYFHSEIFLFTRITNKFENFLLVCVSLTVFVPTNLVGIITNNYHVLGVTVSRGIIKQVTTEKALTATINDLIFH